MGGLVHAAITAGVALAVGVSTCAVSGPARSHEPELPISASTPAADVESGRSVYRQNCARCHGFKLRNPASGVFDLRTFPRDDKDRFFSSVGQGMGAMPAWAGTLTTSEIEALWLYIQSEATLPP